MNINELKNEIINNLPKNRKNFQRVFHGRGNFYESFDYLTVDSINKTLFATFFSSIEIETKNEILNILKSICDENNYENLIIQNRYSKDKLYEVFKGEIPTELETYEFGLKYKLNFKNQNIGFFPDMKNGRKFIKRVSKNKKVLNLFAYSCSFSLNALSNDADLVVNVDMSKSILNIGKQNHELNNLDLKKAKFLPFNILKSWSKIKKFAPYDVIIIDPPSFQKGSFEASKDYEKLIKRLDTLASEKCIVLSCLNAPELDENFIKDIFKVYSWNFKFHSQLNNPKSFKSANYSKALKNLIFKNYK